MRELVGDDEVELPPLDTWNEVQQLSLCYQMIALILFHILVKSFLNMTAVLVETDL